MSVQLSKEKDGHLLDHLPLLEDEPPLAGARLEDRVRGEVPLGQSRLVWPAALRPFKTNLDIVEICNHYFSGSTYSRAEVEWEFNIGVVSNFIAQGNVWYPCLVLFGLIS